MDENKQIIKGDNNNQQTIIVRGDYKPGINRDEVLEMITKYSVVNKEEIISIVKETIESIDEKNRIFPDRRIFIPIIQQLSYSMDDKTIKDKYRKLLNSSMDKTKSNTIHPSFANIISQLSSDEIKILNKLPPIYFNLIPIINLKMKINGKGAISVLFNFSDIGFDVCDFPNNIGLYLENLERLKLIKIPPFSKIQNKEKYEKLKKHPTILQTIKDNQINDSRIEQEFEFEEGYFYITTLGVNFLNACIK